MSSDLTPVMGDDERRHARHLSLQSLRPPVPVPGCDQEQFLGKGAFGEVWVAVDRNTGRRVAIKYYTHQGGLDWSLLSREVEKLRLLSSDRHIAQLFKVGWDADPPYYVMEYLPEGSLEDRLKAGPLPVAEAVSLFRDVVLGLVHAHGKGILHCDLKPANILLDQDYRPRLADFGQSRLSHEQAPALGTLFYMAPEQADLKAVPDARWDVYALGAVLCCMLTGQPPYRTEVGMQASRQSASLEERLERYRQLLGASPPPTAHRRAAGIDRGLVEIIDKCLALNPKKRFANAQAVVEALDARALRRARRPLLVLGAVAPALILMVVAVIAGNAFNLTVSDSERELTRRALESNRFAAQSIAQRIAGEVDRRWKILERGAADGELHARLRKALDKRRGRLGRKQDQAWWLGQHEQKDLQEWLKEQHQDNSKATTADSWLVTDFEGWVLARSPLEDSRELIGTDLSYRDWFHGLGWEIPKAERGRQRPSPISEPHRSLVVESVADGSRRVLFSVPVRGSKPTPAAPDVLGVLAISVRITNLRSEFRPVKGHATGEEPSQPEQFATVVDCKADWNGKPGLVLEHPKLEAAGGTGLPLKLPEYRWEPAGVRWLNDLRQAKLAQGYLRGDQGVFAAFDDPVGGEYQGRWLATAEPVVVERGSGVAKDTGWVVLVQERYDSALGPVQEMRARLALHGLLALALVVAVVTGLWVFVMRVLNDSSRSRLAAALRRRAGLPTGSSSGGSGSPSPPPRPGPSAAGAGSHVAPALARTDLPQPGAGSRHEVLGTAAEPVPPGEGGVRDG